MLWLQLPALTLPLATGVTLSRSLSPHPIGDDAEAREWWHQVDSDTSSSSNILSQSCLLQQTWVVQLHPPSIPNIVPDLFQGNIKDKQEMPIYHNVKQVGKQRPLQSVEGKEGERLPAWHVLHPSSLHVYTQLMREAIWKTRRGRTVMWGSLPCQRINCCH